MPATATSRIDGLTTSVAVKPPCIVATNSNITLEGEQTVNGVAVVEDDRVLVKDQTDQTENGIYTVSTGDWVRARDFDGARDAVEGTLVIVVSGTGQGTLYRVTTPSGPGAENPIVFGTSDITFDVSVFGDSSTVNFTQAGTGAVTRTAQAKMRDIVSVKDFGAVGDGVTDDAAAIALAITYCSAAGAALYFPAGVYLHATTIVFKNNVRYYGSTKDLHFVQGSVLKYTGISDGIQVNNPINSSTDANYSCHDLTFYSTTRTAGKACFADVGSSLITFERCEFIGNDYGLILDQSELVRVVGCAFDVLTTRTAGVWLVNGAQHTVGASALFTNRITIDSCQFYGAGTYGIADDGGIAHIFTNNNFDSLNTFIWATAVSNLQVSGSEMENPVLTCIRFALTKHGGAAGTISQEALITSNFMLTSSALNMITFTASSLVNLSLISNEFDIQNAGSHAFSGRAAGVTTCTVGFGNTMSGISTDSDVGNTIGQVGTYTPTWTATGTAPALGNGTSNGNYTRNGNTVTVVVELGIGSTSTQGTGDWIFSLPFAVASPKGAVGSAFALIAATTFVAGSVYAATGTSSMSGYYNGTTATPATGGIGITRPAVWATGDTLRMEITYQIANT